LAIGSFVHAAGEAVTYRAAVAGFRCTAEPPVAMHRVERAVIEKRAGREAREFDSQLARTVCKVVFTEVAGE
jgi:hypothetical protein